MSTFTLAISFDHFQFALIHGPNVPGSYAILLFTPSELASITSPIHNWVLFLLWLHPFILSGVISPLISRSILGTFRPGEFLFQSPIILPFHTVHETTWDNIKQHAQEEQATSKEQQLRRHRRTERSYSTFKVRRGDREEIPLTQGTELRCSLLGQPWREPHVQGKKNPSKMVSVARGHQRADRLKPSSQKTSQSDHRTTALSWLNETVMRVGPPKTVGSWWSGQIECGPLEKEWQTTPVFLPWEPQEQYEQYEMVQPLLKRELTYESEIPLLGVYSKELK